MSVYRSDNPPTSSYIVREGVHSSSVRKYSTRNAGEHGCHQGGTYGSHLYGNGPPRGSYQGIAPGPKLSLVDRDRQLRGLGSVYAGPQIQEETLFDDFDDFKSSMHVGVENDDERPHRDYDDDATPDREQTTVENLRDAKDTTKARPIEMSFSPLNSASAHELNARDTMLSRLRTVK